MGFGIWRSRVSYQIFSSLGTGEMKWKFFSGLPNDHLWTFMGDKICVWWWRQSLLPPANFFLNIDHKCSDEDVWDICTSPCICWWFFSNCQPLFVISSFLQYWSFPPWVQLNTSCRCIANELMHSLQWKQGLLIHMGWYICAIGKNISYSISKHTGRFFHGWKKKPSLGYS